MDTFIKALTLAALQIGHRLVMLHPELLAGPALLLMLATSALD